MKKNIFALLVCLTLCGAALFAQTANEADFEIETEAEDGGETWSRE
jgi:hypothetical protein